MCIFPKTPTAPDPVMPTEYAAQRAPKLDAKMGAGSNIRDRLRASSQTFLTPKAGVGAVDMTGKKTLLGA